MSNTKSKNSPLDFTVAIPIYNGADRIVEVIDHLRVQVNTDAIAWEILIVDNNSDDGLADLIQQLQHKWTHPFPLRYIHEPQQGVTYARCRAVQAAQSKYIGFLDDDNLADPHWVTSAYTFGEQHPEVGAYGSQILPQYEAPPPPKFDRVKTLLVIRNLGKVAKPFNPKSLQLPPTAGLVIRKQAWLDCVPAKMVRMTRGGDDYQISLYMHNQGWQIWYNPDMQIYHQIPAWRMEKDYLCSLAHLYGLCTCELTMLMTPLWLRPLVLMKNLLGAIKRLALHLLKHNRDLKTDLDVVCNLAFAWGNVMSPWFYLRNATHRMWGRIQSS
ncbi:MAG: glycosyltransferase family 2 protein [Cyanothece sp. SIO2G6]|nr:glycosyltransferase family 2 protein [Cyanothece sp. SIO2G6]